MKFQQKCKRIIAGLVLCLCVLLGMGWIAGHSLEEMSSQSVAGSYELFSGEIYDENRLEPVDMAKLMKRWEGKTKQVDSTARFDERNSEANMGAYRHYVNEDTYLIGWQYVQKDGVWDWYYFDEETGYMISDTILDGVVLSSEGYAIAVSATSQETLEWVQKAAHCNEVLLSQNINATKSMDIGKDLLLVGKQGYVAEIKSKQEKEPVMTVCEDAILTIAANVSVSTNGNCQNGIEVFDQARLDCHGRVGDTKQQANYAIAVMSKDAQVQIYPESVISGAAIGVYSQGHTVLTPKESEIKTEQVQGPIWAWLCGTTVYAENVATGQKITGNTSHGILQEGGTLTMSGGQIYDNGTLGGYGKTGSYGGGVCLKNGAVMNMTGGSIGGNRGSYGGGIYVDDDSFLYLYGGTLGGSKEYHLDGTNDVDCGNYAREECTTTYSMKYACGGGGGICSKGTVSIPASSNVTIANNAAEGSVGGGGILIMEGNLHLSGNVLISNNHVYSSQGTAQTILSDIDVEGEGAGIRIGTQSSEGSTTCTINCENTSDFPQLAGSVRIHHNDATGDGGGIYVAENTNHQLIIKGDTRIYSNTSNSQGGGAIKTDGGAIYLYGTKIYDNQALDGSGGGVSGAGIVDLENCDIYDNLASSGGGVSFFTTSKGLSANGYVHGCNVYHNTSFEGGSGVEIIGQATGSIQGYSKIYENRTGEGGLYNGPSATLMLGVSDIYGNDSYGVYNLGTASVTATAKIGFATYSSTSNYLAAQNMLGGFYNQGNLTVNNNKMFYVYGGDGIALNNDTGNVVFKKSSNSRFYGVGGNCVVLNTGTITASEKGLLSNALVVIVGDDVRYGIDNNGGNLYWNSDVRGDYNIQETSMSQSDTVKGLEYGVYNRGNGKMYLTGGKCCDCSVYGIYCESGSQLHMSQAACVDAENPIFLDKGCYIDVDGELTASGTIAVLDTMARGDRVPGRIMATVSYSGGTGAGELYDASGNKQFLLTYETVDSGGTALLLDGSDLQGVSETVALDITEADIYLATDGMPKVESQLEAWLYNRSAWLRNQMQGNKQDQQYKLFAQTDTGVITFTCVNLTKVSILWPRDGGPEQLSTYDAIGTQVVDQSYAIEDLTEDIRQIYENNTYQFRIPTGTPEGTYHVTVLGTDAEGKELCCVLPLQVGNQSHSATFRTRIR